MSQRKRVRAQVEGLVQGVGFRPFVHGLATALGLGGQVGNDSTGVFVDVEGDQAAVTEFLSRLQHEHPPLALVDRITVTNQPPAGATTFQIAASRADPRRRSRIPPDVATCPDCLRELTDPADRRHRHPFISCTDCGPRFTIVTGTPYDRPQTTMAGFPLCPGCHQEYDDPGDRRFHAQPVCCPACGPRLTLCDATGAALPGEPVAAAAALLRAGRVVAVKGLGGYHLAVDGRQEPAVAELRTRKHRDEKPFAVMVPDLVAAAELCHLASGDEQLLRSPARPIVLLRRRDDLMLASNVAPGDRRLGLLLPYTPVHHLLLQETAGPIVLTSGNRSDEPIAYQDEPARRALATVADAFLTHDRPIQFRADDSVARTFRGTPQLLRRSRGYVPNPIRLPRAARRPVLGCGAELKNTFCLADGEAAFLSAHIGDLRDYSTLVAYRDGVAAFQRLLGLTPLLIAHDLHPDYLSTRYARELPNDGLAGAELVPVQHHHAHIAACLVDNQETGPVLGVALDGTGYGPDGTLWGGELLVADLVEFQRVGLLCPAPLPGGMSAIRQPWRMAVSYLDLAYDGAPPPDLPVLTRHATSWPQVRRLARGGGSAAPSTSSAGRLFDAAAAILGLRDQISYEGQAAIELEQLADPAELGDYPMRLDEPGTGAPLRLRGADLIRAVADELRRAVPPPVIAARFHNGLAAGLATACLRLRERTGLTTVALSGGVFQNELLLARLVDRLAAADFRVLTHTAVPPNDGGVSLGQAAIAAAQDRAD
ncbi:carbamoyltransferase HypF [Natronosporangium hydrolyticum]|uniref:Carbamoyltransferase n=1 Tax=Natronosporangium hydrolyticum TaxID=2811111 RepID=A0A895YQ78_9ACTN|nr:carbamoyltransferase HypF [Natronosporangium hydrolyticum]QSB16138.1 carbamoyltransferase HypF [Natronosporangium hydrolyticum]